MRHAKAGRWWESNVQRALANNSACYTEKPDMGIFMEEWKSLYESKSGERGIFNRQAAKDRAEKNGRRDTNYEFGTNPCSEIILRDREFCNLTEVVIRGDDTEETLIEKVKLATILGTFQSTLTNFRYLNRKWGENCEEERLLGVSMTGIMDNALTNGKKKGLEDLVDRLREVAIQTNKYWAKQLGIPQSAAILICLNSNFSESIQKVFQPFLLTVSQSVVHDACHRYTE
jgi:ribonucleoside-diphosphate reductase alpha chain